MSEFLQRLKQRKLVQWGVAYIAAAFALLQGIDIVAQQFGWPEGVRRGITLALVVGFFVALVLAWYHGERGAQRMTGTELLILALLLALGGGFLWRFASASREPATTSASPAMGANSPLSAVAIPEKSIAVLPFENLSDEKANAYFADGIQDEILTRLAKVGALKVISRTSTSHYASSPDNLPEIARQLGVANLLEGSVQKVADAVHINVQLIRAATDDHLWAESYNRKLTDIFAVEGEVAEAIAVQLDAKLSGTEKESLAAQPTDNPAAYDAYLHGLGADNRAFGSEQLKEASRFYAQAVQLDPNFALAWGHGSNADGLIYFQAFDHSIARLEAARHGAEMAMKLAPESGEALLAKGYFLYHIIDYDGAAAAFEEASRRLPNNPEVFAAKAFLERRRGHYERACELLERSLERDPQNINVLSTLGETLTAIGRPTEARHWFDRGLSFRPGDISMTLWKGSTYMSEGNLDAAGKLIEPLPLQIGDVTALGAQLTYLTYRRNYAAIIKTLQGAMSQPGFVLDGWTSVYYSILGWAKRWAGDEGAARATFLEGKDKLETLVASSNDNGYLAENLAGIDAGLGDSAGARREAERGIQLAGKDQSNLASANANRAVVFALLGRQDQALTALEALAREPIVLDLGDLRYSPSWDNLRKNSRFKNLIDHAETAIKQQL